MNARWCPRHGITAIWRDDSLGNPRCALQDRWGCECNARPIAPEIVEAIQTAAVTRFAPLVEKWSQILEKERRDL